MNVGNIVEPNAKGQIVIPKRIRDELGIDPGTPLNMVVRDNSIYLYPVTDITTKGEAEISHSRLLAALERTRGIWADDKDFDRRQKIRRKIELAATKERKKSWW